MINCMCFIKYCAFLSLTCLAMISCESADKKNRSYANATTDPSATAEYPADLPKSEEEMRLDEANAFLHDHVKANVLFIDDTAYVASLGKAGKRFLSERAGHKVDNESVYIIQLDNLSGGADEYDDRPSKADQLNGIEWLGVGRVCHDAARVKIVGGEWQEWVDANEFGSLISYELKLQNGDWVISPTNYGELDASLLRKPTEAEILGNSAQVKKIKENEVLVTKPGIAEDNEGLDAYREIRLPCKVVMRIPKNWEPLGEEWNKAIAANAQATIDLSGLEIPDSKDRLVFRATSRPLYTYASISVEVGPRDPDAAVLKFLNKERLKAITPQLRTQTEALLRINNYEIKSFEEVELMDLDGNKGLVMKYTRSGSKGDVLVWTTRLAMPSTTLNIQIAYREHEKKLWEPVVQYMVKSLGVID